MQEVDKNGYAPSILQEAADYPCCYLCMKSAGKIDRHEVFGASNRGRSKSLGLWVNLCRSCHEGAHRNRETALLLKRIGQKAAMECYGLDIERFITEFGKNYL